MIAHPAPAGTNQDPSPAGTRTEVALQASAAAPVVASTVEIMPSAALLRGGKTVAIEHNGEIYRLQATRSGKLILTK